MALPLRDVGARLSRRPRGGASVVDSVGSVLGATSLVVEVSVEDSAGVGAGGGASGRVSEDSAWFSVGAGASAALAVAPRRVTALGFALGARGGMILVVLR